jgi:hypothetical protein
MKAIARNPWRKFAALFYEPPSSEFPPLIVIFGPDGEVLTSQAAISTAVAEEILQKVLSDAQAKINDAAKAALS